MRKIFLLSVATLPLVVSAQNLVPNGDFEMYEYCPYYHLYRYFLTNSLEDWFSPNAGTADFFHSCSQSVDANGELPFSTPTNLFGYQQPRSGEGYIGLLTNLWDDGYSEHEYACVKLSEPLEANRYYHVEYYVSLADTI